MISLAQQQTDHCHKQRVENEKNYLLLQTP